MFVSDSALPLKEDLERARLRFYALRDEIAQVIQEQPLTWTVVRNDGMKSMDFIVARYLAYSRVGSTKL